MGVQLAFCAPGIFPRRRDERTLLVEARLTTARALLQKHAGCRPPRICAIRNRALEIPTGRNW